MAQYDGKDAADLLERVLSVNVLLLAVAVPVKIWVRDWILQSDLSHPCPYSPHAARLLFTASVCLINEISL